MNAMDSAAPCSSVDAARGVLARRMDEPGALLPILHDLQDVLGHIPAEAVPEIAGALNLSRAEVHGVLTYYHHFRSEPAGRHVIRICRAEACQSMGAEALAARVQAALQIGWGDTSADCAVTLEPVYCLGLCATAPALLLDDEPVGRLDGGRLAALLDELRAGP